MTKDELIANQQIEIEELKLDIREYKKACENACNELIFIQQWSTKCNDFPRVAMNGVVKANEMLRDI